MKYIIFENNGTLEPEFIKSFGVSVKNDKSCIGFFGTGLKYALAIAQREGAKVSIYSGKNVMRFGVKNQELKGKSFQFVTMNDEVLPFTTELGKTWEPWMAYRELYSNAKDEGGSAYLSEELPSEYEDKTYIVIAGGRFEELHEGRESIFVNDNSQVSRNIYANGSSFFTKGVCTWRYEGMPSIYSYNDATGYCDLTEDRQIKYRHQVYKVITEIMAKITDREILEKILLADIDVFEGHLDFDYCAVAPSIEFMEVGTQYADKIKNRYLKQYIKKHSPRPALQEFALNNYQQEIYNQAVFAVKMAGFTVDDFPVRFIKTLGKGVLGQALGGEILIAEDCFLQGGLELLKATLIEEWVHLKYGYGDCERDMQNYLFAQIVRLVDFSNTQLKTKYAA